MERLSERYRDGNVHRDLKSVVRRHEVLMCDRVSPKQAVETANNSMFVKLCKEEEGEELLCFR